MGYILILLGLILLIISIVIKIASINSYTQDNKFKAIIGEIVEELVDGLTIIFSWGFPSLLFTSIVIIVLGIILI